MQITWEDEVRWRKEGRTPGIIVSSEYDAVLLCKRCLEFSLVCSLKEINRHFPLHCEECVDVHRTGICSPCQYKEEMPKREHLELGKKVEL